MPEDQIPILEVYAAACEQSPLAAEVYSDALIQQLKSDCTVSLEAYQSIAVDALARVQRAYADVKALPEGKCLHSLLFKHRLEIKPEVRQLIRSGMFSNFIEDLLYGGFDLPEVLPQASFIVLAAAAEQDHLRYKTISIRNSQDIIAETIVELYSSLVRLTAVGEFNTLAKTILRDAFKMRLLCDTSYRTSTLTFEDLLRSRYVGNDVLSNMMMTDKLPKGGTIDEVHLPCHITDPVGFYNALADPANMPAKDKMYVLFHLSTTATGQPGAS